MSEPSRGVYVKPRWAWELDEALSGFGNQALVAGQFAFVNLYNNDNAGRSLGVSALWVSPTTANESFHLLSFFGTQGADTRGGVPLQFDLPTGPGRIYLGTAVTLSGTIFFRGSPETNHWDIVADTPFFVIPPGWSFQVAPAVAGRALSGVTFWWAPFRRLRRARAS
jgi:hypothetical protein